MKMPAKKPIGLKLPTEKTIPSARLSDYSILIYGEKKIGKTSLAASFPDALMLFFEPGGKALSVYGMSVTTWDDFLGIIGLLEEGNHPYRNVVIDTVDIAYKVCFDAYCRGAGIEHPQDEKDFGKSWGQIKDSFTRAIVRLMNLSIGTIFISHAEDRELKTRTGFKYHRIVPTMPSQANKVLTGLVDCIFYYHYDNEARQLTIEGDEFITAGVRLVNAFNDPQGNRIRTIPMGQSADEGYRNLIASFNNTVGNKVSVPEKRKGIKLNIKK